MGAWIETNDELKSKLSEAKSRPVWARGLKHMLPVALINYKTSRPVWARGLKHLKRTKAEQLHFVAPRVGAWIETELSVDVQGQVRVAPRVGAWIETHCA